MEKEINYEAIIADLERKLNQEQTEYEKIPTQRNFSRVKSTEFKLKKWKHDQFLFLKNSGREENTLQQKSFKYF